MNGLSDFRLRVFSSVARHLSFTKASQELYISQPAISKHIQELERNYGIRLFERMGNNIVLTAEGVVFQKHCECVLQAYERLSNTINEMKGSYTGELRLGASTTITQYVLPPLLAKFVERYPDIHVSLVNGNSYTIEQALIDHQIDLGLVETDQRFPHLKNTFFMKDELVLVASANNPLANKDSISLKELQTLPLVLREQGSGTLDVITRFLEKHNLKLSDLNVRMQLGSTESIKRFVENSYSVAFLSVQSVRDELYQGRLKVVDIDEVQLTRDFTFVQLQGFDHGVVDLFMRFLTNHNI